MGYADQSLGPFPSGLPLEHDHPVFDYYVVVDTPVKGSDSTRAQGGPDAGGYAALGMLVSGGQADETLTGPGAVGAGVR